MIKREGYDRLLEVLHRLLERNRWSSCNDRHCKICQRRIDEDVEEALSRILAITGVEVERK